MGLARTRALARTRIPSLCSVTFSHGRLGLSSATDVETLGANKQVLKTV